MTALGVTAWITQPLRGLIETIVLAIARHLRNGNRRRIQEIIAQIDASSPFLTHTPSNRLQIKKMIAAMI